jgi:methylglyoxal synthase
MIALIAHDTTKDEMLTLAEEIRDQLEDEAVVATATAGGILGHELELDVCCVLSVALAAISRSARWWPAPSSSS